MAKEQKQQVCAGFTWTFSDGEVKEWPCGSVLDTDAGTKYWNHHYEQICRRCFDKHSGVITK
ncbi:hypothetical protein BJD55_gp063 [Gordonia phage Yvonnetastic]|uniref:Uncharacterized protein n=1 Tax=Gordonia phage Yvonnetastic TaxID=1821566 RepID=A0A142K9C0_9CAUD|nr:hypothetical protein BJD55_gp063 [Gordonia phage Yvonnetastic]AMS02703.1 hypothetical protein SEA_YVONNETASTIC_159 [Gordonia phage Yvonnetastic]WKW86138.1 hypothetical protein SEA_JONJAMES_164 [Gordonia Phage JonJames]